VSRKFSQAAESYDANALVQRRAVELCQDRLLRILDTVPRGEVLEIGCGTGLLSERLLQILPDASVTLTDPSIAMLNFCRRRLTSVCPKGQLRPPLSFECLTAEDLCSSERYTEKRYALIASSFALQWVLNLDETIDSLLNLLLPGGVFLFCVPARDSFPEWKAACHESKIAFSGNQLPTPDDFMHLVQDQYSTDFVQSEVVMVYDSALHFFRTLRLIGATARLGETSMLTSGGQGLIDDSDVVDSGMIDRDVIDHDVIGSDVIDGSRAAIGNHVVTSERQSPGARSTNGIRSLLRAWQPDENGEVKVTYRILCGIIRKSQTRGLEYAKLAP
jgi:malonyl-CoA O-methyltransferase